MLQPKVKMLKINDAAQLTGQPPSRIRQWCINGDLPHVKAGKVYLINQDVLLEFLGQPKI
jgi:excisionase family DNA binding protein